jgi:ribonuclease D
VEDGAELDRLVEDLDGADLYAIDTEFHRERTYFPHVALVQVAWAGGVALVDAMAVELTPLARVVEGPGGAVAHAADQDLEVLRHACGAVPTSLFDTQLAAGFLGLSSPSLGSLVERFVGVRLPKGDRLTDWTRRPLTAGQRAYAAADVSHLLGARLAIRAELEERGRLAWAEEECRLLLSRVRQPQDPATAWWRMKDARSLRGPARGVAQSVAAWRERRAATLDVPPRFVLPDLALGSIAHKPPGTAQELAAVRGLDPRHLKPSVVSDLLEAVAAGSDLPPAELRLPPAEEADRRQRPAVALAAAWVSQLGADLEIDAALLATRADLQALLRGDPDARLSRGWRAELVGEPVRRLAAGEASLAFDGRGGLVLEARSGPSAPPGAAAPGDPGVEG